MTIPFRDDTELESLGMAAYLKIQSYHSGYEGALFLINAFGEPQEFTYTRLETLSSFLWRKDDIKRCAARKITASLFSLCPREPRLLLCLAEEVESSLFCQDIHVSIPVCRIAPHTAAVSCGKQEVMEESNTGEPVKLFWLPDKPIEGSEEQKLFHKLISGGLLTEPFERATSGLLEVYTD